VQTAQLDGETNLKIRNAHEKTVPLFQTEEDCATFVGRLVCEEPHENFAKFNGTLFLEKG
jgi:phospholipid-transporting ATPase